MFHVLVPCILRLGNAILFFPVSELGSLFIDDLLQSGALQFLEELGQIVVDVDAAISQCAKILITDIRYCRVLGLYRCHVVSKAHGLISIALSFMARTCSGKSSSVPSQK